MPKMYVTGLLGLPARRKAALLLMLKLLLVQKRLLLVLSYHKIRQEFISMEDVV